MRVSFAPQARLDLIEIGDYLRRVAGDRMALRWMQRLEAKAMALGDHPYAGMEDEQLGGRRRVVLRPYLIVYRVDQGRILVVRIVHGARDLPGLFD